MRKRSVFMSWICLLISQAIAEECVIIADGVDEKYRFESGGIYETKEMCIRASIGYTFLFTVDLIETDPKSVDFLIVKQGQTLEDDGAGMIFLHRLDEPRSFVIYSEVAYVKFSVSSADAAFAGFSLTYQLIGEEVITTTKSPVPESTWPQPEANDSVYFTAYVSGYEYKSYATESLRLKFRQAVAKMAVEYIATNNNFTVIKDIGEANVIIHELKMCPIIYPDSHECAMITFALPIFLDATVHHGYELKEGHLSVMWDRYGKKYLAEHKFSVYQVPDVDKAVTSWGAVVGVVVFMFLLLIGSAILIHRKILQCIKANREDGVRAHIIDNEQRDSIMSLSPHQLQVFPPIFDQPPVAYQDDSVGVVYKKNIQLKNQQYDNEAYETET